MTPEIILHIGVHKTGSTHIQVALTRNSDWLIRQGIYYKPSDGVAHHSLIQSFADTKSDDLESAKIKISNMIKDAGSKDCKKIIISSEVMSESHINIEKLHKFISEIGSVSVYSYIRNPVDQLISAYNQIVRDNVHRRTFGFTLKNKGYDPSYKSMLFPWIDTGAQLKILPYDKNQWILNDIVSDFLFSIGASKYDQYSKENIVKTSNGSLPYPLLDVLRLVNKIEISENERDNFIQGLYELVEKNPERYFKYEIMTKSEKSEVYKELNDLLPTYRKYFRDGFNEYFLTEDGRN